LKRLSFSQLLRVTCVITTVFGATALIKPTPAAAYGCCAAASDCNESQQCCTFVDDPCTDDENPLNIGYCERADEECQ